MGTVFVAWGVLIALLLLAAAHAHHAHAQGRSARTAPTLAVAYAGTDYYTPSDYYSGCGRWVWLTSCYTHNPTGGSTAQHLLADDAAFMAQNHLGQFQRIWVMLDQGIVWNGQTYGGLDATYLANLDDALATFHAHTIQVDAVLLEASQGSSDQNQFRTEALDGQHPQMRDGYLQALRDLVTHLAHNPTDAATVSVMDLCNEAYYQLERFGLSDTTIHQWLQDEYSAARTAAPQFNYTVSDTTRLLKDYATWNPMYPGDVIDEHLYDDAPWANAAFWERTAAFGRPWFAGEAGCTPGNVSCTYNGTVSCSAPQTCAQSVDGWWLRTMRSYGAQAVLIEDRGTAWTYSGGPTTQTPTLVGQIIQQTR